MTTTIDLDGLLDRVLRERGPNDAPSGLAARAIAAAAPLSQPPVRIAALDRRTWPAGTARTSGRPGRVVPAWRSTGLVAAALLGLLMLALIAAGVMVGSRRPAPSPFAAIVPAPTSLATPRTSLESLAGPSLVYGRHDGGLVLAGADGSGARDVLADGWYIHPRLSTDRRWIAAGTAGSLGRSFVILRRDGSVALRIPSDNPIVAYAWGAAGPAATWLAVAIDDTIVVVDPSSGSRLSIDTGDTYVQGLAWSPDAPVLWWAAVRPGSGDFRKGYATADVHAVRLDETNDTLRISDQHSIELALDPARRARELEEIAVSPDGRHLALRARIEGWLRSDLLVVDADGGPVTYLTAAPPGAPWLTAWSGIRWLPDGSGVVAEVGDTPDGGGIVRPAVVPLDGTPPRPIDVGRLTVEKGGVVEGSAPVLPTDTAVLVGGAGTWLDLPGYQVSMHDLWVTDANGTTSRLVATDTLGGDLR
jgi:hypothetical protein